MIQKRTFFFGISVWLLILTCEVTHAQFRYGPFFGLNSSDIDLDIPINANFERRVGFELGWIFDYSLGDFVSLSVQTMYIQKGVKVLVNDVNLGTGAVNFRLDYVEIPVFLKFGFGTRKITHPYLFVGPNIGINLNSTAEVNALGFTTDLDIDQIINSFDLGLGIGMGLHFAINEGNSFVFFEGRYVLGLTNILDEGVFDFGGGPILLTGEAKNNGIQFIMGVSFPLNR